MKLNEKSKNLPTMSFCYVLKFTLPMPSTLCFIFLFFFYSYFKPFAPHLSSHKAFIFFSLSSVILAHHHHYHHLLPSPFYFFLFLRRNQFLPSQEKQLLSTPFSLTRLGSWYCRCLGRRAGVRDVWGREEGGHIGTREVIGRSKGFGKEDQFGERKGKGI